MRARLTDRRSPLFIALLWACVGVHLAVFAAAGWHAHLPCDHAAPSAGIPHSHDHEHPEPGEDPHNGRDPDGCGLCRAIVALGHGTLTPPVLVVTPPAPVGFVVPVSRSERRESVARTRWGRGPPTALA